ncbi:MULTISPECIES: entry exclusion lipoprotein TrbK [unclassified Duganella]|uniref:entry exclusion lipoprotein TrbK n=1 Tax=unclassified Duganella TaxID=2636909 RepID=UPI000E356286|nr:MULTISPECIES: entry exclusion lipoprotein TrbK [unclassified Duganella]RFP16260.1 entry exclusion lipoprotein TrbK [Duganella sp. BJB475]RFP32578.1 entry exclusion lipoprotein TrbK [Duganella sp. BJB476]
MKSKTNVLVTLAAATLLGVFGYRGFTRQVQPVAVSAATCTPEYIRGVGDAMERAILAAQCAKAARK